MNKILAFLRTLVGSGSSRRHDHGASTGHYRGDVGRSYDRGREEFFEEEGAHSEGDKDAPEEDPAAEEEFVEEDAAEGESPSEQEYVEDDAPEEETSEPDEEESEED
ncbi:MAG: hypothetical protein QGG05_18515 [Candidatus Latescibacteria bacterium]|nr:hypothetical protein [Candidatus Latescibacterota bacterium]